MWYSARRRKPLPASLPVRSLHRGCCKALEISCTQGDSSWLPWSFITFFGPSCELSKVRVLLLGGLAQPSSSTLAAFRLLPCTQRAPLPSGHLISIFPCQPSSGRAACAPSSTLVNFHRLFRRPRFFALARCGLPLRGGSASPRRPAEAGSPRSGNGCGAAELARSAARARPQGLAGLERAQHAGAAPGRGQSRRRRAAALGPPAASARRVGRERRKRLRSAAREPSSRLLARALPSLGPQPAVQTVAGGTALIADATKSNTLRLLFPESLLLRGPRAICGPAVLQDASPRVSFLVLPSCLSF